MASRIRPPETVVIPISQGDTITVKRFLNAAEFRQVIRAATRPMKIGANTNTDHDLSLDIDPTASALATILAYLLDWTFTDFNGHPILIREQPADVVTAALDAIDADSYMEVQRAIQAHDTAMRAWIAAEKKTNPGSTTPAPILRSVG